MYSTIDDLGVATTALATGSLLSEASRRELLLWRETTWPGVECGFLINRDARGVGHEGNVPGFQAVARYQPDRRRSIVVLTNLSNNADRTMPAEVLFDMLAAHHDAPQRPEAPSAP
jgi:D-alanyl-D-alanine carboxypeptidase